MLISSYQLQIPTTSLENLLEEYPELQRNCKRQKVNGGKYYAYDFSKSEHQYEYNERLVQHSFGAPDYRLSRENLCPGVTGRLEYLKIVETHLIQGLEVHDEFANDYVRTTRWIIDIGTGSLAIYPVLGQKLNPKNRFIGTEINEKSLQYAREMVEKNGLGSKIDFIQVAEKMIPLEKIEKIIKPEQSILYTVCNPPFYSSPEELQLKELFKTRKPNELSASDTELFFPGGEVAFVVKMIDESIELNELPIFTRTWFTVLVGILDHLRDLEEYLKGKNINNVFVGSFGSTTKRWVLAWNFDERYRAVRQITQSHRKVDAKAPLHETVSTAPSATITGTPKEPSTNVSKFPSVSGVSPSPEVSSTSNSHPAQTSRSEITKASSAVATPSLLIASTPYCEALEHLAMLVPFRYTLARTFISVGKMATVTDYLITSEPVWWRRYRRGREKLDGVLTLQISCTIPAISRYSFPCETSVSEVHLVHTPSPQLIPAALSLFKLIKSPDPH